MKKITFLLVGAALALAACSKTETVNEPSVDAIGFNGAYIGNPTDSRTVTELDDNTITSFQVYGQYTKDAAAAVQVFNNVEVSNTTGSWTYTGGLRPWIEGAAYVFAGYAPSNVTAPAVNAGGYLSWANYDVSANQYDLIYATQQATGQTYGNNQQVVFTFNHLLSIVGFTFKSSFDADTELTISNVAVNGVPSTATFTPDNTVTGSGNLGGSWGAASSPQNYQLTIAPITEAEGSSYDNFFAIPQTVPSIEVSFNVTVTSSAGVLVNNQPFTTTVPTGTVTEWDPGYKYNYVATITPESVQLDYIQFGDPTVTPWTPATDETLPLQ